MTRRRIPDEILTAAHDRAKAREARDWPEADRLREEIEAAGWKVVDRGTDFALSPAAPIDIAEGERIRYGSSQSVPSRFDEASVGLATVVVLATDHPDDLERLLSGLRNGSPEGTSVVIVANAPSPDQARSLAAMEARESPEAPDALDIEIIWTSERLGHAAATNIGLRRASAPVVILLDTNLEPTGDVVTPLAGALVDPTVAIVGGWGTTSTDLRHFEEAPAGDVDAIEGCPQAFRRSDAAQRGPFDERFRFDLNVDVWWSLVLRDSGEDEVHRRAVRLEGLPVVRHEPWGSVGRSETDRDRQDKRSFYRIIDRFGWRRDLLIDGS